MKKLTLIMTLILAASMVAAETELNGYIKLDERIYTQDPVAGNFSRDRAYFGLQAKNALSDQVVGYGELKIYTGDSPNITAPADLTSKGSVTPVILELREAYLDIFAWPFANTDLRLGKQRIAWGKADKLNPTDNLNAYDFSDLLDFGEKLPSKAIYFKSYLCDNTFDLAILPGFTPSLMPGSYTDYMSALVTSYLPAGTTLATMETQIQLPPDNMSNSMLGLKFGRNVFGTDMSISYFNGYDSVPSPKKVTLTAVSPTTLAANITLDYPKIGVFGYDLAGDFNGIGYWAEAAFIYPDQLQQQVISPTGTTTTEVGQYTKYTLGFDYSWDTGIYWNTQWMHGFFDERGNDLHDFIVTRLEKKLYDDKVELAFNWLGELNNDKRVTGNLFGPVITFFPADATKVELGAFSVDGELNSKMETFEQLDQVFLRAKYSF